MDQGGAGWPYLLAGDGTVRAASAAGARRASAGVLTLEAELHFFKLFPFAAGREARLLGPCGGVDGPLAGLAQYLPQVAHIGGSQVAIAVESGVLQHAC